MPTPLAWPTPSALRPLLVLLLFFVVWSERAALQAMADATSVALVQLAADCGAAGR